LGSTKRGVVGDAAFEHSLSTTGDSKFSADFDE
jgi:hypothetical protein